MSYKKTEVDMPLSAAKTEDNTFGFCHRCRLLSSSIYLYLLLSSIILSCTGSTVFHSYKPLPAEGWERRDTICFEVPEAEADINGTLTIGLRTSANVGMRNVVLLVEQCGSQPSSCRKDTVRYPLTDADGFALSRGVNHHQYETQHLPFRLRKGQGCTVRINHLMRHEEIAGITELGIRIEP